MLKPDLAKLAGYVPKWPLRDADERKSFFETTHRGASPEATLERFGVHREFAGITRLADITYLDVVGIPTYVAVRPQAEHPDLVISVYNGKGLTKTQAKASAMMEAFERFAAERRGRPTLRATLSHWRKRGVAALDPNAMVLPPGQEYDPGQRIEWVRGLELLGGTPVLVPAAFVFFPYLPSRRCRTFERCLNTNGLASGNSLGEALVHGLSEVIERDSESLAEASGHARSVPLDKLPSELARTLAARFSAAGINLSVKEITSDVGVPTFFAASDDPLTEDPLLLCRGVGAHLSPEIAVLRAVTEAAQSRCTIIGGAREDLEEEQGKRSMDYRELKARMGYWYGEGPDFKNASEWMDLSTDNFAWDLRVMLDLLAQRGFNQILAVQLTRPEAPVPVVRVLVPGMEQAVICGARRGERLIAAARRFSS
ncbi:MAG: YcaO-like family protein [Deltaproteobacteria bacterium]|nr:YcaO-like family protein [Deltaproteobacteria bacterium]